MKSASLNKHVRQELEQFRDQCHYHLSEIVLRLEDCWVSRRERWFAVLSAPMLGHVQLAGMPQFGFPVTVKQVVPRGIDLNDEELAQLTLRQEEHLRWKKFCPDIKNALVPLSGKCPTALHSWGSQLSACACGCRLDGFSDNTLSTRGIYGILFPCDFQIDLGSMSEQAMRHPHPTEVALMTGVPVPSEWKFGLKLALAGLGQQAAPFQIVWLAGQIRSHTERLHFGGTKVDCNRLMDVMRDQILLQSKQLFGKCPTNNDTCGLSEPPCIPIGETQSLVPWVGFSHDGGRNMVTTIDHDTLAKTVVQLEHGDVGLAALIQAESKLQGDRDYLEVTDGHTGVVVSPHECIGGRCLVFQWWPNPFTQPVSLLPAIEESRNSAQGLHSTEMQEEISPTVPFVIDALQNIDMGVDSDEDGLLHAKVPCDLFDIQEVYTEFALQNPGSDNPDCHPNCADAVGVIHNHDDCGPSDDPVVALTHDQLCSLLRPLIGSFAVLDSLRKQCVSTVDRLKILDHQSQLTADDEIRWHIDRILQLSGKEGWYQIDPLILEEGLHRDIDCLLAEFIRTCSIPPKAFVGVVRSHGHWIPFVWQWNTSLVSVWSWDVSANHPEISPIHKAIARVLGVPNFMVKVELRNFSNANMCGICAIRFVDCMVRGKMLPTCLEDVKYLHATGRELFLEFVVQNDFLPRPWTWGSGLDPKAYSVSDLFEQHGVPKDCIDTRIDQAVQALGVHPVQQAMLGSFPWKTLKAISNNCRPPFQLVLPAELQDFLQKKSLQNHVGKGKKLTKGVEKKQLQKPQALDPSKVVLEKGSFAKEDATVLSHISFSQVGPFAEGVALATLDQMECHLKAGQHVTQNALAIVVLNGGDSPPPTTLLWHQIRVLVRCQANNEPLLVPAILVQLGKKPVVQAKLRSSIEIPAVPAACCKISVYRDMVDGSWQQFVQGPVRYLFQHLPMFEVCKTPDCDQETCVKWHQSTEQVVGEPVLDVWRRQWLSLGFKVTSPEDASIFVVNFRYVQSLQDRLMACSGKIGIFVEPRTLDSRSPLLDFQVIWLKEPLPELLRIAQVNPLVVGLARLGSRLGVRTTTSNASELAKQLKPGSIFLASGSKSQFELGPLPYGMDRLTVSKVCAQWGWQARPMFPIKALEHDQGTVWLVQAVVDPPDTVFSYKGGEIIITKIPDKVASGPSVSSSHVVASASTLGLCTLSHEAVVDPKGDDPWAKFDPWSNSKLQVHDKVLPPVGLKEVEDRIEKAVLARVAPMEVDDQPCKMDSFVNTTEARFAALEQQVLQLHTGQQSLEQQVDASTKRCDAQLHHFQQQFGAQLEAQGAQIQTLFRDQMQQIESLLSKKARTE